MIFDTGSNITILRIDILKWVAKGVMLDSCLQTVIGKTTQVQSWDSVYGKMAGSHENKSSVNIWSSRQTNNATTSIMLKSSYLYLSEGNLFWKGDSETLKEFVKADLQLSGRWSLPRGETIQFNNPEFCLKWHGLTNKKLTVVQDNNENNLYIALKSYTTLPKSTIYENQINKVNHVASVAVVEDDIIKVEDKDSSCGHCEHYRDELNKLLMVVNEIQKKQDEDWLNKSKAEIKSLIEQNNKMVVEIQLLKANKQGEWTKVGHNFWW